LPARNDLEALLARRLEWIRSRGGPAKSTKFDSLFVTDRYGTMIAAAFANEPSSAPIGENFAYRSYFSGQSRDLSPTTPRRNIQRTTASHLSVPFKSTTTNRWKIAVSTPISVKRKSLDEQGPDRVTEGLLVLTINIGDLQLLSTEDQPPGLSQEEDEAPIDENINRQFSGFAVLVDGHEGQREGTILQHPFFATWNGSEDSKSADGSELKFQIDEAMLKKLKEDGTYRYIDPVSKHPAGQAYQGQWIAAMEKVEIARKGSDEFERRQSTSLLLLVQVPADSITVPISHMGQKLAKLFLYAVVALLLGIAGLWLIVSRFLRTPDQLGQMVRPRVTTQTGGSSDADATLGVE